MSYSFRIRVNRPSASTIETDLARMDFVDEEASVALSFRAAFPEKSIKDADQWVLIGDGYDTEHEALVAGERYQDALMLAFAKNHIGADFGSRAPKSTITNYGLQYFEQQIDQRTLHNFHGLMVYESLPLPRFVAMNVQPIIGRGSQRFVDAMRAAIKFKPQLTDRDRVAFTLYQASFFQPTADSRFVLLVMAIEALIEPKPKSDKAIACVDAFISQISSSALAIDEKNSLIGSLRWLRDESISHAGKRLARERLGDKTYHGMTATKFFSYIYSLRSNLVHGNMPYPSFDEISNAVSPLESFVSDVLTTSLPSPPENAP